MAEVAQGADAEEGNPGRQAIPETILDLWFQHSVATEQMETCKDLEQQALTPAAQAGSPLHTNVRKYALWWVSYIIAHEHMSQENWFQAVALLDTYFLKGIGSVQMLPVTCVCVVRLVKKFSGFTGFVSKSDWLSLAANVAPGLVAGGFETPEITQEILDRHVQSMCSAVNWQLDVMTVERWMSMFSIRFDSLVNGCCKVDFNEAMLRAGKLVNHEAASLQFSHHDLALGVFSLCLFLADLIPLDILRPNAIMDAAFLQNWLDGRFPENILMAKQVLFLVESLQAATCTKLHIVQQATQNVIESLAAAD